MEPFGVVALNLGGPDTPEAVRPFLQNLFSDPDVIQLPPGLRLLQRPLAWAIARKRAPVSRAAYRQIGGASSILAESTQQVLGVVDVLEQRGIAARPYVAMGCWHPFAAETVAAAQRDGTRRLVGLPLFPQWSRTTTGSLYRTLGAAAAAAGLALAQVSHYPTLPGFITALGDRVIEALATLPADLRAEAPVLFSAHGLPEAYVRRGDPYLDEVRATTESVARALHLGARSRLCFQSRVGPQRWLGPHTDALLEELGRQGVKAVCVCPVAFTGEHIETLQELDIVYRDLALESGIRHYARARTVGCHPGFLGGLADLTERAARDAGWLA